MEYRKSYPTDAYLLVQLRNEVWKNTYYDVLPNRILQYMKENKEEMVSHLRDQIMENNRIIVALEDNKIVGYIFYAKSQIDLYDTAAEIREIIVLPHYQRKGIGRKLYQLAKKELKKLGYHNLIVSYPSVGKDKEFFQCLGGEMKEKLSHDILGYPISCDLFSFQLDDTIENTSSDWQVLYQEVQKKIGLLNDINKEIAAVMSPQGNIYFGLGIKNKVCPLEGALSNLYLSGEKEISKIMIMNKNSKVVLPCGKCRDLFIYLGYGKAEILFDMGSLKVISLKDLNPYYKDEEKV